MENCSLEGGGIDEPTTELGNTGGEVTTVDQSEGLMRLVEDGHQLETEDLMEVRSTVHEGLDKMQNTTGIDGVEEVIWRDGHNGKAAMKDGHQSDRMDGEVMKNVMSMKDMNKMQNATRLENGEGVIGRDGYDENEGGVSSKKTVNILMQLRMGECRVIKKYCVVHQEQARKVTTMKELVTRNSKTGLSKPQMRKVSGWYCKFGPEFGKVPSVPISKQMGAATSKREVVLRTETKAGINSID